MTVHELHKKVGRIRAITDAKMKYLKGHTKFLDQAFEELKAMTESELGLIDDKIEELDNRMDKNGLA